MIWGIQTPLIRLEAKKPLKDHSFNRGFVSSTLPGQTIPWIVTNHLQTTIIPG